MSDHDPPLTLRRRRRASSGLSGRPESSFWEPPGAAIISFESRATQNETGWLSEVATESAYDLAKCPSWGILSNYQFEVKPVCLINEPRLVLLVQRFGRPSRDAISESGTDLCSSNSSLHSQIDLCASLCRGQIRWNLEREMSQCIGYEGNLRREQRTQWKVDVIESSASLKRPYFPNYFQTCQGFLRLRSERHPRWQVYLSGGRLSRNLDSLRFSFSLRNQPIREAMES